MMLLTGILWLIVGIFVGFFIAIDRALKSPELEARLDELREIRYEAERAKTLHSVAKMMERVNKNLLLSIIDQFNKDVQAHLDKQKEAKND